MDSHTDKKIHFLGIGGSGMSGVACIAKSQGYEVTGCDSQSETAYSDKLRKFEIPVTTGHDVAHLQGIDHLVVTPAALFKNPLDEEVQIAKEKGILMTWQEFLGKHLQKGNEVICISGTHGKSTTTALAALIFESAQLDPSVMIGATIKEWGANFRVGKGKVFITESDEFYDNFLNYDPDVIILNNIEFDHPDFFKSKQQLYESFKSHISKLKGRKTLIVNQDSEGIKRLLGELPESYIGSIKLIGYTLGEKLFETPISIQGHIIEKTSDFTKFKVISEELDINQEFVMKLTGDYNVENALGTIALSSLFDVDSENIRQTLSTFNGVGRRLELLGEVSGIKVYDDYAHHPTAISKTLIALKQRYPDKKILSVIEPHSFSRTKALLSDYENAFSSADKVIIGPIFKARDTEEFGVSGQSIVDVSKHNDITYVDQLDKIIKDVVSQVDDNYVVVVMGAGESYKWAKMILENIYI